MLQEVFEKIRKQYNDSLPFVAYRKPNDTTLHYISQQNDVIYKATDFTESGFVFSPFNLERDTVLIPFNNVIEVPIHTNDLPEIKASKQFIDDTNGQEHIDLVSKAIEEIKKGKCKKIVLSRCQHINNETHPITLFQSLLKLYPTAFVYLWYHPKVGCWLAATPEQFLNIRGRVAKTMSLAGTQLYSENIDWQEKEKEEQQLVTDFIIATAKPLVSSIKVSNVQTVKAGNLAHLKTDLALKLSQETDLKNLILSLHPTPAVCGLPKTLAKNFILENENYDRSYYTGFLGELNKDTGRKKNSRNVENGAYRLTSKTSDLYVNLRCMQLTDKAVTLYVGGGITASSNPISEFEETIRKAQTMLKAIKTEKI